MELTIENNHIKSIVGDKAQPYSRGYACSKGLQAEEAHHGPLRLLRPLKRLPDGRFVPIPLSDALDEIAERMRAVIDRAGSEAIALFAGSGSLQSAATMPMHHDFLRALGSHQYFSTATIDQSAKRVAFDRLGGWTAGLHDLHCSDVVLLFGTNPLVSHLTIGLMGPDPTRRMKQAKADGLKVICVDPRMTETARFADVFLQPLPGHDSAIAAAMIRTILMEGWADQDFCKRYVGRDGMYDLTEAVAQFLPELVEGWAELNPGDIRRAAKVFAHDHSRGAAFAATGPSMAPFSNLTHHLVETLNVICGRLKQAGDPIQPCPLSPRLPIAGEVIPPPRMIDNSEPSRIRGTGQLGPDRLTGTLADEILTPGDKQIRALIADGGNAANCIPDQNRIVRAFQSLDLMVTIDPYMTVTAQLSDYVIPPLMMYERPDIPLFFGGVNLYVESWSQFTPAVLEPPPGSELIENWQVYWELARRLGKTIQYCGRVDLDMREVPSSEDLLRERLSSSPISLDELASYPSGKIFDMPNDVVQPSRLEDAPRFDVMPQKIHTRCEELLMYEQASGQRKCDFPYLLASRRMRHAFNSTCTNLSGTLRRSPYNPLSMNPEDMAGLDVVDGDTVKITSPSGWIEAKVSADVTLRRSVVTLPHGWGSLPDDDAGPGFSVNSLIDCRVDYEPDNAMPRMSAIPVRVERRDALPVPASEALATSTL